MTIDATVGYARIPAILSFPDTTGFAETYGFGAASGRVWLEGQYLVPSDRASKTRSLLSRAAAVLRQKYPLELADDALSDIAHRVDRADHLLLAD